MNMTEFAKLIGMDEDEFFLLSYEEACEVCRKHGYEFTGFGIQPIPKERLPKEQKDVKN
jgi:hypothetical protein